MWVSLYRLFHYGNVSPVMSTEEVAQTTSSCVEKIITFNKKQQLYIMKQCIELLCHELLLGGGQIEQINLDTFEVEGADEAEHLASVNVHDKRNIFYFRLASDDMPRVRLRLPISNSVLERSGDEEGDEDKPFLPTYLYCVEQRLSTEMDVEAKIADVIEKMEEYRQQHLGVILWQQILYLHKWSPLWGNFMDRKERLKQQAQGTVSLTQFVNTNNINSANMSPINSHSLSMPSSIDNNASDSAMQSNDSEKMYEHAHEIQNYVYQACYEIDLLGETGVQGEKIREGMDKMDIALWNQLIIGAYRLMGEGTFGVRASQMGIHRNDYSNYTLEEYHEDIDSERSSIMTTPENYSLVVSGYRSDSAVSAITDEQVQLILGGIHAAANEYLTVHTKHISHYSSLWTDSRESGRLRVTALRVKIAELLCGSLNKSNGLTTLAEYSNLAPSVVIEKIQVILNDFFMSKIGERRPGILHDSFIAFLLEELKKVPNAVAILGAEAEAGIKLDERTNYTAKTPLMKVIREAWRHAFSRLPVSELEKKQEKSGMSSNIECK